MSYKTLVVLLATIVIGTLMGLISSVIMYTEDSPAPLWVYLFLIGQGVLVGLASLLGFYGRFIPPIVKFIAIISAMLYGTLLGYILTRDLSGSWVVGVFFAFIAYGINMPRRSHWK